MTFSVLDKLTGKTITLDLTSKIASNTIRLRREGTEIIVESFADDGRGFPHRWIEKTFSEDGKQDVKDFVAAIVQHWRAHP